MPSTDVSTLVTVSHGTRSQEGRAAVAALIDAVARAVPGIGVESSFIDVQVPKIDDVVRSMRPEDRAVVIPFLLSSGYQVHEDIVRAVDEAAPCPGSLTLARPLGPDDRLVSVLRERLVQVGATTRDRIVLAAAGSSDQRAIADCRETARRLGRLLGIPVTLGFLAASEPTVADAVRMASSEVSSIVRTARAGGSEIRAPRIIVSSYLLAPGYFYDLLRVSGADLITSPLLTPTGPVPAQLVELVVDRYRQGLLAVPERG